LLILVTARQNALTDSAERTDNIFRTKEPKVRFVCIDPDKERETGEIVEMVGQAPLKYDQRVTPNGIFFELKSNSNYEIRYTTDGSEPKENGGLYNGEFPVSDSAKYVRAVALYDGQTIDEKQIQIDRSGKKAEEKKIDLTKSVLYRLKAKKQMSDTESAYKELEQLAKFEGLFIKGASAYIYEKSNENNYVEYNANIPYLAEDLRALIDLIRDTSYKNREAVVTFEYKELMFTQGSQFNDWLEQGHYDLTQLRKEGEIIQ